MEVARMAVAMVLGITLPWLAQWLDKRRMSPPMRARTWPLSTWGASLYAFGPLSMLGWMWVTRPRWRRILAGALSAAALLAVVELVDVGLRWGLKGELGPDDAMAPLFAFGLVTAGGTVLLGLFEVVAALGRRAK